ncbi:hypothetical protein BGZ47_005246, partial [Haplosporangium gracile]
HLIQQWPTPSSSSPSLSLSLRWRRSRCQLKRLPVNATTLMAPTVQRKAPANPRLTIARPNF